MIYNLKILSSQLPVVYEIVYNNDMQPEQDILQNKLTRHIYKDAINPGRNRSCNKVKK